MAEMNIHEAWGYLARKADKRGLEAIHAIKMERLRVLDALTNERAETARLAVALAEARNELARLGAAVEG